MLPIRLNIFYDITSIMIRGGMRSELLYLEKSDDQTKILYQES